MNLEPKDLKAAAKGIKLSDDEKAEILSACSGYKMPKRKYGRVVAAVAAVAIISVLAVAVVPSFMPKKNEKFNYACADEACQDINGEAENAGSEDGKATKDKLPKEVELAEESIKDNSAEENQPTKKSANDLFENGGGFAVTQYSMGGDSNGLCIPFRPEYSPKEKVSINGERLTDEEAAEYFKANKNAIASSLSSSGVNADDIQIAEKGYSHLSYTGAEDKPLELNQNYRDYLVYNGKKLVAIVTLVKENGKIYDNISFGAKWYDSFNKKLNEHKGEKLTFLYAGSIEIVVAPDGDCFCPMGWDVSDYMEGIDDPYKFFYAQEQCIYIP